jgi:hypothetical protein
MNNHLRLYRRHHKTAFSLRMKHPVQSVVLRISGVFFVGAFDLLFNILL